MLYVMNCSRVHFLSISLAPLTHISVTLQYFFLFAFPYSILIIKHTYLNKKRPCITHSLVLTSSTEPHQKERCERSRLDQLARSRPCSIPLLRYNPLYIFRVATTDILCVFPWNAAAHRRYYRKEVYKPLGTINFPCLHYIIDISKNHPLFFHF